MGPPRLADSQAGRPRTLTNELASGDVTIPHALMSRWQVALEAAEGWLSDLSTSPARRCLLLKLSDHTDPAGTIWPPRRDEIGAMLAMTVETASRLISTRR